MPAPDSFSGRGGWWVAAQLPLMLFAAIVPVRWGVASFEATHPATIAGILVAAAGVALAVAGFRALGRALTPFPRPLDDATLREDGIYGRVRHPIYGGIVIASLGWTLAWQSLAGALATAALLAFFDRKAAFEERLLRERFPGYADYARRVRKLLPGIY